MTPNITDITSPARVALECGLEGIAAINTIQSVLGVDLDTLRPFPTVEGYSTPGGYSSVAVKPIALAKCMSIAKMIKSDYPGYVDECGACIMHRSTSNQACATKTLGDHFQASVVSKRERMLQNSCSLVLTLSKCALELCFMGTLL